MKPGGVHPFVGAEDLAQFVAFAASMHGNSSQTGAIREIGRSIGEFTKDSREVTAVAVPLLVGYEII